MGEMAISSDVWSIMRRESKAARPVSLATLVEKFQELPVMRKHLYFYIFLFLIAILGQTIKNASRTASNGQGVSVEQEK